MRKLMLVVALIAAVVFAAASGALEVNKLRTPAVVLPATWDTLMVGVPSGSPGGLPSGVLMFTGDGSEFWVSFGTYASGVWTFGQIIGVPGSATLPVPVAQRSASGDSLWIAIRAYADTDTLSYIWTDQ